MISAHGSPLAPLGNRETGGMNVYVRELSRELGQRGVAVDVYTRRIDPSLPEVELFGENVRVVNLKAGPVAFMDKNLVLDNLPEFICNVLRFSQRQDLQYDYIHSHYWLSGWAGLLLSRRWCVPHAVTFHTLGRLKNRAKAGPAETDRRAEVEARVATSADAIVVSSEHERQALVELYGAHWDHIHVVPSGVDLGRFQPLDRASSRARLGLDGKEILVAVGRMDPVKGLDMLIQATALLKDHDQLRVLIIGGGDGDPELARLKALARAEGVADRVDFLGARPQVELPTYYSAADICVVPSHYESFGLVAAEALACGTPVIASKVGGLQTIVQDGENGLLVPWRSPQAFAESIDWLLADRAMRDRFAAAARPSVERFSWDILAEHVYQVYRAMAESATPQPAGACRT